MAEFIVYDAVLQLQWEEWVGSRPVKIQEMCKSHPGNRLYQIKRTGQRVTISSYFEDGTVTVFVDRRFNLNRLFVDHSVFGIKLEDLIEADLPTGCTVEHRRAV